MILPFASASITRAHTESTLAAAGAALRFAGQRQKTNTARQTRQDTQRECLLVLIEAQSTVSNAIKNHQTQLFAGSGFVPGKSVRCRERAQIASITSAHTESTLAAAGAALRFADVLRGDVQVAHAIEAQMRFPPGSDAISPVMR